MKSESLNLQINLSELTTPQLSELLWTLKGTTQAQPLYQELMRRSTQPPIKPDDPDWNVKFAERLADSTLNRSS